MLLEGSRFSTLLGLLLPLSLLSSAQTQPALSLVLDARGNDPIGTDKPVDGGPLYDPTYLPAQIGGIVGAYAVSLVLVAITLIALSKKRREHLAAGQDEVAFEVCEDIVSPNFSIDPFRPLNIITQQNFNPLNKSDLNAPSPYTHHSPSSSIGAPGVNPFVDQRIVAADRNTAQTQLEDMYKHVLEHEDAKKRGLAYEVPLPPGATHQPRSTASVMSLKSTSSSPSKKERTKPAGLNLGATREEKTQSRTSSFLSALRSPKKKNMRGVSISSPLMTPQSGEFPVHESQEMSTIPPRHYAPTAPPPVPTQYVPYSAPAVPPKTHAPPTPDVSPQSVQSIDERIGLQLPPVGHARTASLALTEHEPDSATSEHSQVPLVGLPSSPKPGARFPSLPSSPKPGSTFNRGNAPSAIRTGGSLPLRAYEPALASPNTVGQTTKQTVFERKGPLSPSGAMTPHTAGAVPYSPYQPFTPCMPVTPSLVTKDDRKRMRRMVPKTPTMDMVRSSDDVW
ncbi:hypothetical protein FZEAL_4158 [Fusarium zealandicum]|uniref:Rna polymerase ii transcription initiation nucleotide excision repair factor tfiih n=1 Tax=Fusarium zealandicum TaxID=1053134 RepID=A0A8H4XLV3_9HYPO|nr:hypothetical protein FZEAL_4158 [Fusarium zealandicum]